MAGPCPLVGRWPVPVCGTRHQWRVRGEARWSLWSPAAMSTTLAASLVMALAMVTCNLARTNWPHHHQSPVRTIDKIKNHGISFSSLEKIIKKIINHPYHPINIESFLFKAFNISNLTHGFWFLVLEGFLLEFHNPQWIETQENNCILSFIGRGQWYDFHLLFVITVISLITSVFNCCHLSSFVKFCEGKENIISHCINT